MSAVCWGVIHCSIMEICLCFEAKYCSFFGTEEIGNNFHRKVYNFYQKFTASELRSR